MTDEEAIAHVVELLRAEPAFDSPFYLSPIDSWWTATPARRWILWEVVAKLGEEP